MKARRSVEQTLNVLQPVSVVERDAAPKTQPNPIRDIALWLYDQGFNVIPMPYGEKRGFPWKHSQRVRLTREGVGRIFEARHNIAIMCGASSENLFVIDCETMPRYYEYTAELRARGIPVISKKTARGAHIYLRSIDAPVKNIGRYNPKKPHLKHGLIIDAEIRGSDVYVLGIGSLHPSGAIYTGLENWGAPIPVVARKDIDFLVDASGKPLRLEPKKDARSRRETLTAGTALKARARDYLKHGANLTEGDRNNSLFYAARDYRDARYTHDQTYTALQPVASASGLSDREIRDTIKSAFSRPAKAQFLTHNLAAQFADTFTGWIGRSDRAVFHALVTRCHDGRGKKRKSFRASVREIATIARLSINTVQTSLRRMSANTEHAPNLAVYDPPLIHRKGKELDSRAALWCFSDMVLEAGKPGNFPETDTVYATHTTLLSSSVSKTGNRQTDALERGALGYTGMRVLDALLDIGKPATIREIAAAAGVTYKQAQRALRTPKDGGLLRESGAVKAVGYGRWQADICADDDTWLNENIARRALRTRTVTNKITGQDEIRVQPVLGAGKRRQARFDLERSIHAETMIERAIERHFRQSKPTSAPAPKPAADKADIMPILNTAACDLQSVITIREKAKRHGK